MPPTCPCSGPACFAAHIPWPALILPNAVEGGECGKNSRIHCSDLRLHSSWLYVRFIHPILLLINHCSTPQGKHGERNVQHYLIIGKEDWGCFPYCMTGCCKCPPPPSREMGYYGALPRLSRCITLPQRQVVLMRGLKVSMEDLSISKAIPGKAGTAGRTFKEIEQPFIRLKKKSSCEGENESRAKRGLSRPKRQKWNMKKKNV